MTQKTKGLISFSLKLYRFLFVSKPKRIYFQASSGACASFHVVFHLNLKSKVRRSIRKINDPISELIVFGTKFQYFTIEITNRALQAKYKSQYKCFNARRHSTNAKNTNKKKNVEKKHEKKKKKRNCLLYNQKIVKEKCMTRNCH